MRYRERIAETDYKSEDYKQYEKQLFQNLERRENEQMWALYQHDRLDLSQRDVTQIAIHQRRFRPTQSQVSRIIKDVDATILYWCATFGDDIPEDRPDEKQPNVSLFTQNNLSHHAELLREAYKEVLAEFIVRYYAFKEATKFESEIDEWALQILPEKIVENHREIRYAFYQRGPFQHDISDLAPDLQTYHNNRKMPAND